MRRGLLLTALLIAAPGSSRADELDPRVMVIPVQGDVPVGLTGLALDVEKALSNGAKRLTPNVSLATASLEETATIVGCDPAGSDCLDSIAAALNVDQLLVADLSADGADAKIDLMAVTRDAEPVRQDFVIHVATRADDLRSLEEAVPVLLEAGEARKEKVIIEPPPPPPPPPATTTIVVRPSTLAPLVTMVSGVAILAGGGVFWKLAGDKQKEIDAAPTETPEDLDRLEALEASARSRALIGNVLVIGGGVIAAAGLTWYVIKRGKREVRVVPAASADGAGVTVGGLW